VQHVTSLRLRAAAQLLLAWSPLMQTEDPLRVALKLTRERGTGGTSCWWLGSMSYCTLRAWLSGVRTQAMSDLESASCSSSSESDSDRAAERTKPTTTTTPTTTKPAEDGKRKRFEPGH
jgi:hypothetical protein